MRVAGKMPESGVRFVLEALASGVWAVSGGDGSMEGERRGMEVREDDLPMCERQHDQTVDVREVEVGSEQKQRACGRPGSVEERDMHLAAGRRDRQVLGEKRHGAARVQRHVKSRRRQQRCFCLPDPPAVVAVERRDAGGD